jgi:hypothetical protein
VPCALFLSLKANVGELDATLYAVQALELAAGGGLNIILMGMNIRSRLQMTGRLNRQCLVG